MSKSDNKGEVNTAPKKPLAKVFSVIGTVLTVIIIAITAGIVINMIYCRANNKPVSFFGASFAIVQTESMEPYIKTGDLIVFHTCDYEDVKVGDYVVFVAGKSFGQLEGQSIVHEAKRITPEGIVTQGKNEKTNPVEDKDKVTADNLIGICTYNSAGWGKLFSFLAKFGILIVVAIIAVPFAVAQIIKIYKLAKKEKEGAIDGKNDAIGEPFAISEEKTAQNEPKNLSDKELIEQKSDIADDNNE